MNKFLFLVIMTSTVFATLLSTTNASAQVPPLEKTTTTEEATDPVPSTPSLGKITIQISQTEQIVIDLPMKSENKYKVIPIK